MPDLRMRDLSGPGLLALVVVIAGVVAILVGTLSSSSAPNSTNPAQNRNRNVEPVAPIDPHDASAQEQGPTAAPPDPADPFAISYGKSGLRKVTIRISGNGTVNTSFSYRDGKGKGQRAVQGTYSKTRTVRGRYPMASVAIQLPGGLPGAASRATCSVTIDGIQVDKKSTTRVGYLLFCIG